MGRFLTFDRQAAIASARDIFWAQGYEATSVPDLERATGLNRSSLYHAFGSKKGLFDEAAQSYITEIIRPLLAQLHRDSPPPDALSRYLTTIHRAIATEKMHPGCLLIAAANAPIGTDAITAAVITDYYAELLEAITAGVHVAAPSLDDAQSEEKAQLIAALNISALALARTNRTLAIANVDAALRLCEDLRTES